MQCRRVRGGLRDCHAVPGPWRLRVQVVGDSGDTEDFTGAVLVPEAYDSAVDLDLKDNPWLMERVGWRSSGCSATS